MRHTVTDTSIAIFQILHIARRFVELEVTTRLMDSIHLAMASACEHHIVVIVSERMRFHRMRT